MSEETKRKPEKEDKIIITAVIIILSIIMWFLTSVEVSAHHSWTCSICGSHKFKEEWVFGGGANIESHCSELEKWINENQGGHIHNWCKMSGTGKNIYGQSVIYRCGSAPAIYSLGSLLGDFVKLATAKEILSFIEVMENGDKDKQRKKVQEVADIIFKRMKEKKKK